MSVCVCKSQEEDVRMRRDSGELNKSGDDGFQFLSTLEYIKERINE